MVKVFILTAITTSIILLAGCSGISSNQSVGSYSKTDVGNRIKEQSELYFVTKTDTFICINDALPRFPGGDLKLMEWIAQHLEYPQDALNAHKEGCVLVKFIVREDGSVGDVRIRNGVDSLLDAEALRVVKSLPKFTPARTLNNKPIPYELSIPITFRLTKDESQQIQ